MLSLPAEKGTRLHARTEHMVGVCVQISLLLLAIHVKPREIAVIVVGCCSVALVVLASSVSLLVPATGGPGENQKKNCLMFFGSPKTT